jgi:hypothetical protein
MQQQGKYEKTVKKPLSSVTQRRNYYKLTLSVIRIIFSEGLFALSRLVVNKLRDGLIKKRNCESAGTLGSYSSSESRQSSKIPHGEISKVSSNRFYYITTKNKADFDQKAISEILHGIASELKKELQ